MEIWGLLVINPSDARLSLPPGSVGVDGLAALICISRFLGALAPPLVLSVSYRLGDPSFSIFVVIIEGEEEEDRDVED